MPEIKIVSFDPHAGKNHDIAWCIGKLALGRPSLRCVEVQQRPHCVPDPAE